MTTSYTKNNQITIKLENNSRISISNRKRHINIRYYFINDRIMKQEEYVELCTTMDMIEDYFTRSLQGYKFRCFCNIILVIYDNDIPYQARL